LYTSLRPEPPEKLEKISFEVFRCFDIDKNGYVSFEEFLLAFAATSQG
jgi:Ca2+-binding EF-hand superfamily protein